MEFSLYTMSVYVMLRNSSPFDGAVGPQVSKGYWRPCPNSGRLLFPMGQYQTTRWLHSELDGQIQPALTMERRRVQRLETDNSSMSTVSWYLVDYQDNPSGPTMFGTGTFVSRARIWDRCPENQDIPGRLAQLTTLILLLVLCQLCTVKLWRQYETTVDD